MGTFLLKMLLSLAMFILTSIAGLSAIILRQRLAKKENDQTANREKRRRTGWIMTILSCFAGGVFMGTCFLDIFPHINENYEHFRANTHWDFEFPLPQFFICCGFFLVYLLEELLLKGFTSRDQRKQSKVLARMASDETVANVDPLRQAKLAFCSNPDCAIGAGSAGNSMTQALQPCQPCLEMLNNQAMLNKQISSSRKVDLLKSFTFVFAISFHSILEGMAMGFQESSSGISTLFMSLIIHKGIEAFSVGLQLSKSRSKKLVVGLVAMYALTTPIGAVVGDLITTMDIDLARKDAIIIVLESLAGGTFIYVTFLEVLAPERAKDHSSLVQLGAIFLGFLVISVIQVYEQLSETGHHHQEH